MSISDVNTLFDLIQLSTVPGWLVEYVRENREVMLTDLKLSGKHVIEHNDVTIIVSLTGD